MIVLFFSLIDEKYAVKCERVREVSPMVTLKQTPHAPDYFAGLFHYRGRIIPVVDLCRLVQGRACRMRLSTRIIVAEAVREDGGASLIGFIAERVTDAGRRDENSLIRTEVEVRDIPYLGGILMEGKEMIHLLDVDLLVKSLPILSGAGAGW